VPRPLSGGWHSFLRKRDIHKISHRGVYGLDDALVEATNSLDMLDNVPIWGLLGTEGVYSYYKEVVQMNNWVELGRTDELADGTMKEAVVEGRGILLARVGDSYYATDNRCPHLGGRLSDGSLEGTVVTCPRHGSQFDLSDGRVVRWLKSSGLISTVSKAIKPPRPLTTYNVKIEDDRITIEI